MGGITNAERNPLAAALLAEAPTPEYRNQLATFGRLVGSWDLDWHGFDRQGGPIEAAGELHLGWVLGGRAIQDVWAVPRLGTPREDGPAQGFHGTTIRFFDPTIDAWRATWIEPHYGMVRTLIGHVEDGRVVHLSTDGDPYYRWSFTAIQPDSFVWTGELSTDLGETWLLEETMLAARRA